MTIELNLEQRQALAEAAESPPRVIDPESNTAYVLVRADVYEKMQALLDEDDVRQMEPLLVELSPEDWEDLSAYEGRP